MARTIRKFVNRPFIKTVDLDLLERLLVPFQRQIPGGLSSLPTHEPDRREALFQVFAAVDELPDGLKDALHVVSHMANPNGARLLKEHADRLGIVLIPPEEMEGDGDGRHLTPRHLALRAYIEQRELFDRVLYLLAFIEPSSTYERSGEEENVSSLHEDEAACAAFREACAAFYAGRYHGKYCEVRWYPEDDEVNVLVLHGKNMVTTNVEEEGGERVLSFREISQDTVRYTPSTGFIRTSAQCETERKELARLFAVHLLQRPDFFEGADAHNLYMLEPINRLGTGFRMRTEWDHALRAVAITEIQIDGSERRADGKWRASPWAATIRDSTNAVAKLIEMAPDVDLRFARIVYIKFRFDFDLDGKVRTIIVKVKPEDRVSFRRDAFERQIMEHLRRNGLCLPRPASLAVAAE